MIPTNLFTVNAASSNDQGVSVNQAMKQYNIQVVDQYGEPIIGASIVVVGTLTGTITDMDGCAVLLAPPGEIIEISYIGYKSVYYLLSSSSIIIVVLEEDTEGSL